MEIVCCGANPQKLDAFEHFENADHLTPLRRYLHPRFTSLRTVLPRLQAVGAAAEPVIAQARELDQVLLRWRGLHLAFAKAYLPSEVIGTGGTAGAPYLQRFLRNTIFTDTTFEAANLAEQFPEFIDIFATLRLEPSVWIAPGSRI
jgi:hypothetical protein